MYSRDWLAALVRVVVFDTVSSDQEESGFEATGLSFCVPPVSCSYYHVLPQSKEMHVGQVN